MIQSIKSSFVICLCLSVIFKEAFIFLQIPIFSPCRKWSKLCVSYDFERNEAQAAFNGAVSPLVKDPNTSSRMRGR